MSELLKLYYEQYVQEMRYEFGSQVQIMSFEEWSDWYGFDENTPEQVILDCFSC